MIVDCEGGLFVAQRGGCASSRCYSVCDEKQVHICNISKYFQAAFDQ